MDNKKVILIKDCEDGYIIYAFLVDKNVSKKNIEEEIEGMIQKENLNLDEALVKLEERYEKIETEFLSV